MFLSLFCLDWPHDGGNCHLDNLDSARASHLAATEAKDKEHGKDMLVEADNIVEVHLVLGIQANLLVALRKHVKHEVIPLISLVLP